MSGVDFQQLQQLAQQSQGLQPNMGMMRQQPSPQMPLMQQPMQGFQPQFLPQPVMPQQQQQQQGPFNLSQAIMAMQRQPMPQVQNPFFGGAIPMDFGLPQASQIPADFVVRQFTPGPFNRAPVNNFQNNPNNFVGYNNYDYGGYGNDGDAMGDDGPSNATADDMGGEDV